MNERQEQTPQENQPQVETLTGELLRNYAREILLYNGTEHQVGDNKVFDHSWDWQHEHIDLAASGLTAHEGYRLDIRDTLTSKTHNYTFISTADSEIRCNNIKVIPQMAGVAENIIANYLLSSGQQLATDDETRAQYWRIAADTLVQDQHTFEYLLDNRTSVDTEFIAKLSTSLTKVDFCNTEPYGVSRIDTLQAVHRELGRMIKESMPRKKPRSLARLAFKRLFEQDK